MGEAKPWQIAVVVVGLLTLVGMVVWQCRSGNVELASTIVLVDVQSGEIIEAPLPKNHAVGFPATNPETQKKSLLPAERTESGWRISGRYIPYTGRMEVNEKIVDVKSGTVQTSGEPVRKSVFNKK
jgi:hypothetical protein